MRPVGNWGRKATYEYTALWVIRLKLLRGRDTQWRDGIFLGRREAAAPDGEKQERGLLGGEDNLKLW